MKHLFDVDEISSLTCCFSFIAVERKRYLATTSTRLKWAKGSARRVNKVVLGKRKVI